MKDDTTLLRAYAEEGSDSAFAELVRRHVDLVYGAALRRTGGDAHVAAEVAQQVFTTLARRAAPLSRHPMLCAWLHTATRNAALNLMISEKRRKARELAALATLPSDGSNEAALDWDRLRPTLDAAIDELPESDRAAVVARFFERKPFAELGAALKISEDAARMRTERSLEKLRRSLARHGITSTAIALEALVTSQPLVAAPAGLAATLTTQALATSGLSVGLAGSFFLLMNAKIIVTAGVSATAALLLGLYLGADHSLSEPLLPPPETPHHSQMIADLRQENRGLKVEVERLKVANNALTAQRVARAPVALPNSAPRPATAAGPTMSVGLQQRTILNKLRQVATARDQFALENGRPPTSVEELVGETKYIRRLDPLDGESYAGLALGAGQTLIVTTASGLTVSYGDSPGSTTVPALTLEEQSTLELERQANDRAADLGRRTGPAVKKALATYAASHDGLRPPTPDALLPYFATPQEGADFVEALEAQKAVKR